mgnify:CR=1 FL=1
MLRDFSQRSINRFFCPKKKKKEKKVLHWPFTRCIMNLADYSKEGARPFDGVFRQRPNQVDLRSALATLNEHRKNFPRHWGGAISTPWRSKLSIRFYHRKGERRVVSAVGRHNERQRNFRDTMTRFRARHVFREPGCAGAKFVTLIWIGTHSPIAIPFHVRRAIISKRRKY